VTLTWYLIRLKKMSLAEVCKRLGEYAFIYYSLIKYRNVNQWPYSRFATEDITLVLHPLPGVPLPVDWRKYQIYNAKFDLTKPVDWHCSDGNSVRWPTCHYAKINYRPGNPHGDVRFNWELSRLQFLPPMAITDEDLARSIVTDWLSKNPYLHGPAYLSAMEVALRWISIYWALCLFKQPLEPTVLRSLTGLAVASGKFIESRLSTHSSAGNHLIVEAVGLFWLGKALKTYKLGTRWIMLARKILWEQICRQIHPDGSNQEQCFWYIGFVLDALHHYLLLEDWKKVPTAVLDRAERMLEFVDDMTLPDGTFPDYGDRDDGYVFRPGNSYQESPFPGLLNIGAYFFKRPEWYRDTKSANERLAFWTIAPSHDVPAKNLTSSRKALAEQGQLKTYENGGMTLMQWGKGRLLFRHARLGLDCTYGHGHADALSVIFHWDNVPVLIDLGSGQYNGDQTVRNFFRSTIAHNTVEIGNKNQARILGPFMWDRSYETKLEETCAFRDLYVKARHNGYEKEFSIVHTRKILWSKPLRVEIHDSFSGSNSLPIRGAFHLGECRSVVQDGNIIKADFSGFVFSISFPPEFILKIYYGSKEPFMGWCSTVYGQWQPINSIIFSGELHKNFHYDITLEICEKRF